jgi:hypothetical protein
MKRGIGKIQCDGLSATEDEITKAVLFMGFPEWANDRALGSDRPMSTLAAVKDLEFVAGVGGKEAGYMAETLG